MIKTITQVNSEYRYTAIENKNVIVEGAAATYELAEAMLKMALKWSKVSKKVGA